MEIVKRIPSCAILLVCASLIATVHSIGVNYGTLGNNLPPPAQVAQFLKDKTIIDRIKIFDVNPDILRAFANTGIFVTVTVPNHELPALANLDYARKYVETNLKPFYPATKLHYVCAGNEILHWGPQINIDNLVPAMRSLNQALSLSGMGDVKVTSPQSLGMLASSEPPSSAKFADNFKGVITAMLQFHRDTKSPFMVNPYPFFGYNPKQDAFSLFKSNQGVIFDQVTGKWYSNLYDMQLDAVYYAMKSLGFGDVDIVVGETGFPSKAEPWLTHVNVDNAANHNGALVRKSVNGEGTPLMPTKKFEIYIFALFNENQKPGAEAEKNFGLFRPDFTPVYNAGIMKGQPLLPGPAPATPSQAVPQPKDGPRSPRKGGRRVPSNGLPAPKHRRGHKIRNGGKPVVPVPQPKPAVPAQGKKWCVPKFGVATQQLQKNIDYVCSQGIDCKPIQVGGGCFKPNDIRLLAGYAMNAFYQAKGKNDYNCDFSHSGLIVTKDPSFGTCKFQA